MPIGAIIGAVVVVGMAIWWIVLRIQGVRTKASGNDGGAGPGVTGGDGGYGHGGFGEGGGGGHGGDGGGGGH